MFMQKPASPRKGRRAPGTEVAGLELGSAGHPARGSVPWPGARHRSRDFGAGGAAAVAGCGGAGWNFACVPAFAPLPAGVQAKLAVGKSDDPLENEADRAADLISGGFDASCCSGCADAEQLRRKERAGAASPVVADAAMAAVSTGGQKLPTELQDRFGHHLGHDFTGVRIFADRPEVDTVGARAFTLGTRVAFAPGQYAPDTTSGRWLIAHELAHVAQQRGGAAEIVRRMPLSVDEIRRRIIALERRAVEPVSMSPGETAALMGERDHLIADLRDATRSSRTTPAARSTPLEVPGSRPASDVPVAPDTMVNLVIKQRGFGAAKPTPEGGIAPIPDAALAPDARGGPLGTGYETNAAIEVLDAEGNQVAFEMARYGGGGDAHAEAQAIGALRLRLAGRNVGGGKLVVAVDQLACGGCLARLRAFAQEQGLLGFEVWTPGREAGDGAAGPKWTARTAASRPARGIPRTNASGLRARATLVQGETLTAPPQAAAASTARPVTPEGRSSAPERVAGGSEPQAVASPEPQAVASPEQAAEPMVEPVPEANVEPVAPKPGGGGMWGGLMSFGLPLVAGWIHIRAAPGRVREQARTEGYVPRDGPSNDPFWYRLGSFLIDPANEAGRGVSMSDRFNIAVWRARIREVAAKVPVGGSFDINWEEPVCSFDIDRHYKMEHRIVTYHRGADDHWATTGNVDGIVPLQTIIGTDTTDEALQKRMTISDPCSI